MLILFNDFHEFSSIHCYGDRFVSNQYITIVIKFLFVYPNLWSGISFVSPCHGQLELYHVAIFNKQLCVLGHNSITEKKRTIWKYHWKDLWTVKQLTMVKQASFFIGQKRFNKGNIFEGSFHSFPLNWRFKLQCRNLI